MMGLKDIVNDIHKTYGALFLNKIQSAKALKISTATLDNYRSMGLIKDIKRGNKIYISIEVIAKALRDGIDATGMKKHLGQA
ncbi:hypothetical protein N9X61_01260 [Sulfurimonas sp.]|nr:hypothetical protein [Sulfurimonas sp.]